MFTTKHANARLSRKKSIGGGHLISFNMNTKWKSLVITCMGIVGLIGCIGFRLYAKSHSAQQKSPFGLTLVAKYEPLRLYIYADTDATNKYPRYLICQGNESLISKVTTSSNSVETTHFENGFQVLMTRRSNAGKISERIMSYNSDSGDMIYSYIDRDGDGMLDLFFDHKNGLYYVNSNLCWILRHN